MGWPSMADIKLRTFPSRDREFGAFARIARAERHRRLRSSPPLRELI
jgi:hypothetical protein